MPTLSKGWGLLAGPALLLGCASYPCETEATQPGATVLSGADSLSVTCKNGASHPLSVSSATSMARSSTADGRMGVVVFLSALSGKVDKSSVDFDIFIPADVADGTYAIGRPTSDIQVSRRGDATATFEGTVTFRRSRDFPFVDVLEPEQGAVIISTVDLSMEVRGEIHYNNYGDTCGTGRFSVGPLALHLDRMGEIGTCTRDWAPRLGH